MKGNLLVHGRGLKHVDTLCNLCRQTAMVAVELGIDTIMGQPTLLLPQLVILPCILGETPAAALAISENPHRLA